MPTVTDHQRRGSESGPAVPSGDWPAHDQPLSAGLLLTLRTTTQPVCPATRLETHGGTDRASHPSVAIKRANLTGSPVRQTADE
jgi:hypothetical protein